MTMRASSPCDGPAGTRICLIDQDPMLGASSGGNENPEGEAMTPSTIIIATDLSARSDRHVERGLAIADDLNCTPVIAMSLPRGWPAMSTKGPRSCAV